MRTSTAAFALAALLAGFGSGCKPSGETATADAGQKASVSSAASQAASQPSPQATQKPEAVAYRLVEAMGRGDWDTVVNHLSPNVAKAADAAKLKAIWDQSLGEGGAYQAVGGTLVIDKKTQILVRVRVALTKGVMDVFLGFAPGDDKVASFRIMPAEVVAPYDPPSYVDQTKFEARDVVVGKDAMALPGTLVVPRGTGPFPAVILVGGSGGGDRDESSGPSKPFRDLAEGLASRGVVVLRYEKRTHGDNGFALTVLPHDLTVKEEYLDDIAAAIDLVHQLGMVDQKRVFVLGHSEGGWLVPWLMKLHPDLAGGILAAGHARWFGDLEAAQITYLALLGDGKIDDTEKKLIDDAKKAGELSQDPALPRSTPASELPYHVPAPYWLSLQGYHAVAVAHADPRPLLILQGGRDYQVTVSEDLAMWKTGLADKQNVDFHVYAKLDHLFFAGEGPITPAEYLKLGHVEPQVIDDVATWLGKH